MEDKQRKAMFASKKLHRIKNLPPLDSNHFLLNPTNSTHAQMLRNAQKLSARTSEQRNKALLREKEYNNAWQSDRGVYFTDPRYIELEKERNRLSDLNLIEKDYDQYITNKPKVEEIRKQMDSIRFEYDNKRYDRKKTQKSSAISFATLHRNALKNQQGLENLIDNTSSYDVDYDVKGKLTKTRPKGFDETQTPNYKNDMWYKLHKKEKIETQPLRDELKVKEEIKDKKQKEYDRVRHLDVDNPEREKAFKESQKSLQDMLDVYDKLKVIHSKYEKIHDSVHGHIPQFKR